MHIKKHFLKSFDIPGHTGGPQKKPHLKSNELQQSSHRLPQYNKIKQAKKRPTCCKSEHSHKNAQHISLKHMDLQNVMNVYKAQVKRASLDVP